MCKLFNYWFLCSWYSVHFFFFFVLFSVSPCKLDYTLQVQGGNSTWPGSLWECSEEANQSGAGFHSGWRDYSWGSGKPESSGPLGLASVAFLISFSHYFLPELMLLVLVTRVASLKRLFENHSIKSLGPGILRVYCVYVFVLFSFFIACL